MLNPLRIGGTRGPDGRTLTDLFNQLSALTTIANELTLIRATLDQLVRPDILTPGYNGLPAELVSMRQYLDRLIGTSAGAGWVGLPDYLSAIIGQRSAFITTPEGPYFTLLTEIFNQLFTARAALTVEPGGTTPPFNLVDNTTGLTGYLDSITQVLGNAGDVPAQETLKSLLAALLLCCQEGNEPPAQPLNQPPVDTCANFTYGPLRVVELVPTGSTPSWGAVGNDWYALDFGDIAQETAGLIAQDLDTSATVPFPAYYPTTDDADLCIAWNFAGNTFPNALTIRRMGSGDFYNDTGNGTAIPLAGEANASTAAQSAGIRFVYILQVPAGTPPPNLNLWLSVRAQAS